jgi:hypothetical protein
MSNVKYRQCTEGEMKESHSVYLSRDDWQFLRDEDRRHGGNGSFTDCIREMINSRKKEKEIS